LQRIEDEHYRYRAELNSAAATPEQTAEHERNLATIRDAHHAV
jgi:hypothetical protein